MVVVWMSLRKGSGGGEELNWCKVAVMWLLCWSWPGEWGMKYGAVKSDAAVFSGPPSVVKRFSSAVTRAGGLKVVALSVLVRVR
jgi:hypothetical protein